MNFFIACTYPAVIFMSLPDIKVSLDYYEIVKQKASGFIQS